MNITAILISKYWKRRMLISCLLLFMIFFTFFIVISNFYKKKNFTKSNVDIILNNHDFIPVTSPQEAVSEKSYYFNSSQVGAYFFTKAYEKINVKATNIISMEEGKIFLEKANIVFEVPHEQTKDKCIGKAEKLYYTPSLKNFHSPGDLMIQCKSGNYSQFGEIFGNMDDAKFYGTKGVKIFKDGILVEAASFKVNYKKGLVTLKGNVKIQILK